MVLNSGSLKINMAAMFRSLDLMYKVLSVGPFQHRQG